jgi:hypothetical protein
MSPKLSGDLPSRWRRLQLLYLLAQPLDLFVEARELVDFGPDGGYGIS